MTTLPDSRPAGFRFVLLIALSAALAGTCHAHPGHGAEIGGIGWGLAHPFTGFEHILAMILVGLWAVQIGKRALWLLPLTFVGAMVAVAALFHGQAHGSEMPADASGLLTAAGFVIATAVLHVACVASGLALQRIAPQRAICAAGVAIFSAAILLGLGVI